MLPWVELIAKDRAHIKYSTVQNWYPGDKDGKGGIYNFVTNAACRGKQSKISWTQVETGRPLLGNIPVLFYKETAASVNFNLLRWPIIINKADTGTKMIHIGKKYQKYNPRQRNSAGFGQNSYRGLVRVAPTAHHAKNYTQCDSLLIGNGCGAHTFPRLEVKNKTATIEHEATTSKISEDQLFYCRQRGFLLKMR